MPGICFYFQVHQPYRLKPYSFFDIGKEHTYFDDEANATILRKVAKKCYLPANAKMLELIKRFPGRFKICYSISGITIEQMKSYEPKVLDSFKALADTGQVEFLAETYYHSLAGIKDPDEFRTQVQEQVACIKKHFGQTPTIFRNTELVYQNDIGKLVHDMGFKAMLAEGADDILEWRSPNYVYKHPDCDLRLLLKNYSLSDDIAFRFSNKAWTEHPLTADKFASWCHAVNGHGETINLFMDYETFGEHQWAETGIFDFLDALPRFIFKDPDWHFETPSELIERVQPAAPIQFERIVSWADQERDLTAWLGNHMQEDAIARLYEISDAVRERNNPAMLKLWRRLQTSDHLYYMCTKFFADGDVHAYFSPYDNPYDAYINFKNVLSDLSEHVLGLAENNPKSTPKTSEKE